MPGSSLAVGLTLLLLILMGRFPMIQSNAEIIVENLVFGEHLRYQLALIKGSYDGKGVELSFHEVATPESILSFPVAGGKFKALVMLHEGDKEIVIDDGIEEPERFELKYSQQKSGNWIRLVYLLASDSDGTFDAPSGEPNNSASAVRRLAVGALLMQTFTAEKMSEAGHGRQTFRLKFGRDRMPRVEIVRSQNSEQSYYDAQNLLGDGELWNMVLQDFAALPERSISKDVVLSSFTRYDGNTRQVRGHTALGGGRLALFGILKAPIFWQPPPGFMNLHPEISSNSVLRPATSPRVRRLTLSRSNRTSIGSCRNQRIGSKSPQLQASETEPSG